MLRRMPQNLVIRTAALPLAPASLVVLYAGEGMAPRGASADAWALTGLVRSFAIELAPRGIRVNVVAPGPVATDMFASVDDAMRELSRKQG